MAPPCVCGPCCSRFQQHRILRGIGPYVTRFGGGGMPKNTGRELEGSRDGTAGSIRGKLFAVPLSSEKFNQLLNDRVDSFNVGGRRLEENSVGPKEVETFLYLYRLPMPIPSHPIPLAFLYACRSILGRWALLFVRVAFPPRPPLLLTMMTTACFAVCCMFLLAKVKASRTLTLEQPPRVLTLHLKQFSFHPKLGPRKLARRVRCDRSIDRLG